MGIYLICFGNSEKNLTTAINEKVIGISHNTMFDANESAYLIVKRGDEWIVVARANIKGQTDKNPFPLPNKYRTYEIINLEKCSPFAISDVLKSELGSMYGLALRAPKLITAQNLISQIEERFCML